MLVKHLKFAALIVVIANGLWIQQQLVAQDNPTAVSFAPKVVKAHGFLKQFEGDWKFVAESNIPDQDPVKSEGKMTGRMVGDLWAVVDVHGDMMGVSFHGHGTFGFESQNKKKYIGTWADSMSDYMWHYEGAVEGNKLVLDTEGPADWSRPGKIVKARDTWEFVDKDTVTLTSEFQGEDGQMTTMAKITMQRGK